MNYIDSLCYFIRTSFTTAICILRIFKLYYSVAQYNDLINVIKCISFCLWDLNKKILSSFFDLYDVMVINSEILVSFMIMKELQNYLSIEMIKFIKNAFSA